MAEKAKFTVGVFAGIMRSDGKLLLRRRVEESSIIPGQSFVGNWELPGGGVMEQDKVSYALLTHELVREVLEEIGLSIDVPLMPMLYPAPFKGPVGYDLALVAPVVAVGNPEAKGEHLWVSTEELNQLAQEFVAAKKEPFVEGKGLLSGYGKRMHCMALASLVYSSKLEYGRLAHQTLVEIQKSW